MTSSQTKQANLPMKGTNRTRGRSTPPGFWAIWTAVVVDLLGFGIVIPLLPLYAETFGAGPITIGVLFASYSTAQFVFAPLWGRFSDRVGRRPVLLTSIAGSAAGSLILALAGSLPTLFIGRIIDGVSGASVAVARATVADLARPEDRPRLMGLLGAAYGIGLVAGPAIGSLAALSGPATPFVVAAIISALNLVAAAMRLPETRRNASRRQVAEARRRPSSLMLRLVGLTFASITIFSIFETTFALLAADRMNMSSSVVGIVFAAFGIAWVGTQARLVGPTTRRIGEPSTIRMGVLLNVVGFAALVPAANWILLSVALGLIAVGQGLLTPTLSAAVASGAAAGDTGRALGFQQSASGLARVAGPLIGGSLYAIDPALAYLGATLAGVATLGMVPRTSGSGGSSRARDALRSYGA